MHPDPVQRTLAARAAALTRWAQQDPKVGTEAARARFRESFREQVLATAAERGESLTDAEATRRGEALRRAWYTRLAAKSAAARKGGRS